MSEKRNSGKKFTFSGAGQQSVTVDSDEHVSIFALDVVPSTDTNFSIKIGTQEVFGGDIKSNAAPAQFFFYDFGRGRGTGVKGDDLTLQMGAAGALYCSYIIYKDD